MSADTPNVTITFEDGGMLIFPLIYGVTAEVVLDSLYEILPDESIQAARQEWWNRHERR